MIFLRLACLLAGIMVLVAPPVVLFPNGASTSELSRSVMLLVAMLLAASCFFFIGMAGHRIKRSPTLGRTAALALLAPFLASAAALWGGSEPATLWLSGALLGLTLIVSLALILPMLQEPSAGRLRAREGRLTPLPVMHHL